MGISERITLGPEELEQAVVIYGNQQTRVKRDIYNLTRNSKTLTPKEDTFVNNDGTSQLLILLDGTIPIQFDGNVYQIPVNLWIPLNYPFSPPLCYVIPSRELVLKKEHQNVDADGKCFVSYTNQWKSDTCDLLGVSYSLSTVFSKDPPLFQRPQSSLPPLVHPPYNNPHMVQPSPPRHPPPPSVHPPSHPPQNIPYMMAHPIPPSIPHVNSYGYPNNHTFTPSVTNPPYSNYSYPQPPQSFPIPSPNPPNNTRPLSVSPPSNSYNYPTNTTVAPLPSVQPPTSRYSHYEPTNSSNTSASNGNLPNSYLNHTNPPPSSTPSLKYPLLNPNYLNLAPVTTPQVSSLPLNEYSGSSSYNHEYSYQNNNSETLQVSSTIPNGFFHEKPKETPPVVHTHLDISQSQILKEEVKPPQIVQIPNLLDGEDTLLDNSDSMLTTNNGPKKDNGGSLFSLIDSYEHKQTGDTTDLKNRVTNKIRDELEFLQQTVGIQHNHAESIHEKLLQSEEHILIGSEILKAEVNKMDELISKIEEQDVQLADWLEKHEGKTIEIDEAIAPSDLLSMQIFDLTAEEAAIEDALYHLSLAFEEGKLDTDSFLKINRTLCRQQFTAKATAKKILELQLPTPIPIPRREVSGNVPVNQNLYEVGSFKEESWTYL